MGNENEILDGKNKLRVEVERILEEALKTARRNVEDEIQKWFDKQNLLIQDKLNEGTLTTYADADAALSNFEKEFMERFSDLSLKERKAKLFEYQYRKIRDIYSYINTIEKNRIERERKKTNNKLNDSVEEVQRLRAVNDMLKKENTEKITQFEVEKSKMAGAIELMEHKNNEKYDRDRNELDNLRKQREENANKLIIESER